LIAVESKSNLSCNHRLNKDDDDDDDANMVRWWVRPAASAVS